MKTKLLTATDLQSKKEADITKYIAELEADYIQLVHDLQVGKSKQTHQLKNIKRAIAQSKTILAQKIAQEKEK